MPLRSKTEDRWIGVTEAARLADVSDTAIRKARAAGKLKAREFYGRTLYDRRSVERYALARFARRLAPAA